MLQQAYREDCLSRTQCNEWYQRLKSGRTSIEDDPKSRKHAVSATQTVRLMTYKEMTAV